MSKVPADWKAVGKIREMRDKISPKTLIIGNGDADNLTQAKNLAQKYKLDGVMIGRGAFSDPFVFSGESPWVNYTVDQKKQLYLKHVKLFAKTYKKGERKVHTLNKFCKIYINGFDGARDLRDKLMQQKTTDELISILSKS
jgi:tRNA-dihydrouridine synthase